nr:zinc finger, CCHC-type [Tanacetum cinerariifolium]
MDVAAMKHLALNFFKLDKFEGVDFRRWQKKVHFLLFSMSVVYVLTTLILEDGGDDATMEQINSLEAKYMVEDASSKKFLVSNFINYKMTDSKPIMEQYNELLDFKHTLKHLKEELTLIELGSHLRIEESLRMQDSDKPKGNNVAGPSVVNMVEHNNSSRVPNKRNRITPYELWTKKKPNMNYLRVWGCRAVVRLPDPKLKTLGERGIECIFVGYAKHSKAFRFYVIEPYDSVSINSIIKSKDAIFDENRFSSVPKPSLRIPNGIEYIGGSVVPKRSLKRFKLLGCKWIFKRKLKVDETIEKFKARLVIHGFKQKLRIDYFDTYAPVARISTIRLLIAMASVHNLIIHQIDVKIAFLNGDLDEEIYMNQSQGFI